MNFYRAFGLVFRSDIPLGSLAANHIAAQQPDVDIRRGTRHAPIRGRGRRYAGRD
ncbi:hypothetical protein QP185_07705 [Sphingomonas aerolata]|uniref:hypothetical protein n=1 Tax=Sphingomonas aerolata TaxID=185951 RepID=UPI002FE139CB